MTYEALRVRRGGADDGVTQRSALTAEQKARRVVLKRVNLDAEGGVRSDFLRAGTMAKGAAETGAVESYMCAKVRGVVWCCVVLCVLVGRQRKKERAAAFICLPQYGHCHNIDTSD